MSLNESIAEDAALMWFGELGYVVGHGPQLAPGEPAAERDSLMQAIARVNRVFKDKPGGLIGFHFGPQCGWAGWFKPLDDGGAPWEHMISRSRPASSFPKQSRRRVRSSMSSPRPG
jgi:hypothetical protein